MTHDEMIAVIEAHKRGEKIERRPKGCEGWYSMSEDEYFNFSHDYRIAKHEPEKVEPVRLQCITCGTIYQDGVPPMTNPAPAVPEGYQLVEKSLIAFLNGSAPLEGVWFGDHHPTKLGGFWWREYLANTPLKRFAAPTPPTNKEKSCDCDNVMHDCDEREGCRVMKRLKGKRTNTSDSELRADYKSRYEHWFKEATNARGELVELREVARAVVDAVSPGYMDEIDRLRRTL